MHGEGEKEVEGIGRRGKWEEKGEERRKREGRRNENAQYVYNL